MAKQKKPALKLDSTRAIHGAKLDRQSARMRENGYITVAEAAELLCRELNSIYRLFDDQEVEGLAVGRRKYIKLSSLIEHVGEDVARIFGLLELQQAIAKKE